MKALAWLLSFALICALAYLVGTLTGCAATQARPPGVISERTHYPRTTYEIRSPIEIASPAPSVAPLPAPNPEGRTYYPRTSYDRGPLSSCYFIGPCRWADACCFDARWRLEAPLPAWRGRLESRKSN